MNNPLAIPQVVYFTHGYVLLAAPNDEVGMRLARDFHAVYGGDLVEIVKHRDDVLVVTRCNFMWPLN